MKISGVTTMHAPADRVRAALSDPNVLVATIPGCQRLEPAGPDSYHFTVAAGVASIQGIYTGQVSLSRLQQPGSFVLTANAAGGPGTVSTSVQVRLAGTAGGTTELSYDADAVITGLIAGIGQRMLSSVARRMAGEFFSSVDDVMAAAGVVSKAAGPAEPGPAPASTATVPAAPQPSAYFIPAAPPAAALPAAASTASGFVSGVLVGAAAALGGMAVGKLIGRRAR